MFQGGPALPATQGHDEIAADTRGLGGGRHGRFFERLPNGVVAKPADETTAAINDVLKELILGIAAVDDVETTGLERASQLRSFRGVAVGHGGVDGNPSEDVEVDMHLGGAVLVVVPQGPNHLGQGG